MGQSLEAFLQWKSLVCLLFECTEAVSSVLANFFFFFSKETPHPFKQLIKYKTIA